MFARCKRAAFFLALLVLLGPVACASSRAMNDERLRDALATETGGWEGKPGAWVFTYRDLEMMLLTDEHHNRMRIISPVALEETLAPARMQVLLGVNFDRTLDARYATWQGKLWAAFIHPLDSLTAGEARAGLDQVWNLVRNYGGSYAGSDLAFNPAAEGEKGSGPTSQ